MRIGKTKEECLEEALKYNTMDDLKKIPFYFIKGQKN